MVKIRQHLVPSHIAKKVTSTSKSAMSSITIHETDNTAPLATADAHARLQYNGNSRSASWHYQVDDKEIVQSFPDDTKCWAGGDGTNGASQNSIHIEICVNSGGNFSKAKSLAQELVAHLMVKHNIPLSRVYQHNHWSGKNCPRNLRKNGWKEFINGINKKEDGLTVGQYKELKELINKQQKEIELLKKGNESQKPSDGLAKEWQFGIDHKLTDGRNPHQPTARQHAMAFVARYDQRALTITPTAKKDIQELFDYLYEQGKFTVQHKVEEKSNTEILSLLISATKRLHMD